MVTWGVILFIAVFFVVLPLYYERKSEKERREAREYQDTDRHLAWIHGLREDEV